MCRTLFFLQEYSRSSGSFSEPVPWCPESLFWSSLPCFTSKFLKFYFLSSWTKRGKHFNGWKANTLSFASRVLWPKLLWSIFQVMSSSSLPPLFIWGSSASFRKVHLVSEDKLCCSKDEALRFSNFKLLNKARMKLSCYMIIDSIKHWVRVMNVNNGCSMLNISSFKHKI